ncbi:MAG: hypothetical protein GKR91_06650 [Pseudomonadales bacterium]|nr:hypothetical protein [Pseudomonadales bacterium]
MSHAKFFRSSTIAINAAFFMLFSLSVSSQNAGNVDNVNASTETPSFHAFVQRLAIQKSALEGTSNEVELDRALILGDRTLRSTIYEMELVEFAAYEIFNTSNSTDDFDLKCERKAEDEDLTPLQICTPAFLAKFVEETGSESRAMRQSRDLYDQLNEEIETIAAQNEELFSALAYRNRLQAELNAMFEEELDDADYITAVRMGLIDNSVEIESYLDRRGGLPTRRNSFQGGGFGGGVGAPGAGNVGGGNGGGAAAGAGAGAAGAPGPG